MTATDYANIRARLDHPRVVLWDACVPTLAPEDPEWPPPQPGAIPQPGDADYPAAGRELKAIQDLLGRFPHRVQVRMGLVAAAGVLGALERSRLADPGPRSALALAVAWLGGAEIPAAELIDSCIAARRGVRMIDPVASAAAEAAGQAVAAAVPDTPLEGAARAIWSADQSTARGEPFFETWWARCRAVLPIAAVTDAEIEWGDIELPPRPLEEDLPGDGSGPNTGRFTRSET